VKYRAPVAGSAVAGGGLAVPAVSRQTNAGIPAAAMGKTLSWRTKENKKVIHLPDGSMVILNRRSEVEYKSSGTTGTREVELNGEAYFDIMHRPEQPFLVHTGKIVTRVLGTAFDIRAYSTDKSIEVTVDHGKVQVLKAGANLGLLSDREQLRFDRGTDSFHALHVALKPVMAWKPEEISFDDITMEEAARRIGQRFKTGFVFANPVLKQCRITATFYMEDDLDQIMTVICGVNQSKYQISGNTVTIDGKGCN
jgi:ferric-dicitrate binding protein FerR (iron transport regulator)